MTQTQIYFENFFNEKEVQYQNWTIKHNEQDHFIDTDFTIELIKKTQGREAQSLMEALTRIDFINAKVEPFLKHLATGYIKSRY